MQQAFAQPLATQSIGGLAERAAQETPEHRAMSALHDRMGTLPPRLQMFLPGCPAGWKPGASGSAAARSRPAPCWPWLPACAGPRTGAWPRSIPVPSMTGR